MMMRRRGDLSRVSTGRKLREAPPRSRRGEVRTRSGPGCSWIDPNFPALMKPSSNHEISGDFLSQLALLAEEGHEYRDRLVQVQVQ